MQTTPFIITQPVYDLAALEHAIMGDIEDIDDVDDVDDFVTADEDDVLMLLAASTDMDIEGADWR
jgi:hypothetical protein